jgi:hypothetical protein
MLKELNKRWERARCQAAAWRRWARKLPHNRVRWPRMRDAAGRVIGYVPAEPIPEPPSNPEFCRKVERPSGQVEVILSGEEIAIAYRLARYPKPTEADVVPLPLTEDDIRRRYERICG